MDKVIGKTFKGAGYGAGLAIGLFIIGFVIEIFNLGCAILTCDCDRPSTFNWSWPGVTTIFLLCVAGGALIGFFMGMSERKAELDEEARCRNAELSEEARKQRVMWADDVKKKALGANNTCEKNKGAIKPLVSTSYKASDQMKDILNEFARIAELRGKVDSLAREIDRKGSGVE